MMKVKDLLNPMSIQEEQELEKEKEEKIENKNEQDEELNGHLDHMNGTEIDDKNGFKKLNGDNHPTREYHLIFQQNHPNREKDLNGNNLLNGENHLNGDNNGIQHPFSFSFLF